MDAIEVVIFSFAFDGTRSVRGITKLTAGPLPSTVAAPAASESSAYISPSAAAKESEAPNTSAVAPLLADGGALASLFESTPATTGI